MEFAQAFQDQMLTCSDCGQQFAFTAGEQLFFRQRKFKNAPKRCQACKLHRAHQFAARKATRQDTQTICAQCGAQTTVPFEPTQGRPVLCRGCFLAR